jgi:hypothetical protein
MEKEQGKTDPDVQALGRIGVNLARLEESEGHYTRAIELLEIVLAHKASPFPEVLRHEVEELRHKAVRGS